MKVLFLIASRNLTSRKEKTLFSILAIAMGIATVIAVFTLDYNTILSQRIEKASDYGRPDLEIKPKKRGEENFRHLFSNLKDRGEVKDLSPIFFASVVLSGRNLTDKGILLCGFSPDMNQHFRAYFISKGRNLLNNSKKEILLSETFARDNKIILGDTIWLKQGESISKECIKGKEHIKKVEHPEGKTPFNVVGFIRHTALGRRRKGRVGIISFNSGLKSFPFPALSPFFWVRVTGTPSFFSTLSKEAIVTPPSYAMISESFQEKAFRNGVRISGILSLALGFFVVFSTLSMSLMEKITEVGLLKAIGLTDRQLSGVFLLEALVISVIGSILGFFLGIGLAYVLGKLHITTLGMGKAIHTFRLPVKQILGIMCLGVMVDLIGALFPLFKARKMPPAKAMMPAPMETEVQTYKGFALFILILIGVILPAAYFYLSPLLKSKEGMVSVIAIQGGSIFLVFILTLMTLPFLHQHLSRLMSSHLPGFFKAEGILAARSIKGSPYRIISTLIGLMLIVAALITLKSMTGSLRGEIYNWADRGLKNNVFITFKKKEKNPDFLKIKKLVKSVVPLGAAVNSPFLIYGIDFEKLRKVEGKAFEKFPNLYPENRHQIVISSELARRMKYTVGKKISMPTYGGKVDFEIGAIWDKFGFFPAERSYGLIDIKHMRNYFCRNDSGTKFVVTLKDGVGYGDWVSGILERRKDISKHKGSFLSKKTGERVFWAETSDEVLQSYIRDLVSDFLLFDIILVMVAALVSVGNINSLLIGALERKREIAILRAVGLTGAQIFKALIIEGVFIGFIGGLLGIIEGIPFAYIVVSGLRHMSGIPLPFVFPWHWAKVALEASVLISVISGLYPAYKMRTLSVIESLQYE